MNLQIDFGNTRLKWRIINKDIAVDSGVINTSTVESGIRSFPWAVIESIQICSVADRNLTAGIVVLCDSYSSPNVEVQEVDNAGLPSWFSLGQTNKQQIGHDRVMAMLGAYKSEKAYCVIDAGTAVTADYVCSGMHKGGYIIPGLALCRDSLKSHTARVGMIDPRLYSAKFEPGLATEDAVEHGLRISLITFCRYIIEQSPFDLEEVYLTGGDAEWLKGHLTGPVQIHEDLVFKGISRYFGCW